MDDNQTRAEAVVIGIRARFAAALKAVVTPRESPLAYLLDAPSDANVFSRAQAGAKPAGGGCKSGRNGRGRAVVPDLSRPGLQPCLWSRRH